MGLCADFGNYRGDTKYDDLAAILPRADSVHAKAGFNDDVMDRTDFVRCLGLARAAAFDGPYSLIYEEQNDEWQGLEQIKAEVEGYL